MKLPLTLLFSCATVALGQLVLTKKLMDLTLESAVLSSLAYEVDPPNDTITADFEGFGYYDEEPDQALFVKKDGYCFGAFRGTSLTWEDWKQNLDIGKKEICHEIGEKRLGSNETTEKCCTSRKGFVGAYLTSYRRQVENQLRECYKSCTNKDECIVLTGHSQGGAVAAVAALYMVELNPYVITFGQPATLEAPCELISSSRWYRWINTKTTYSAGIAYDPVPFAPGLGADYFGHMIVLSDDTTGVAYLGLDSQEYLHNYADHGVEAHSMIDTTSSYPGYEDRLRALMDNATYPIRSDGFVPGSLCSKSIECMTNDCKREVMASLTARCVGTECATDSECDTGRCDSGLCIPKLGSCMPCDEDSDCEGTNSTCKLPYYRCSNPDGFMDDNCNCVFSSDCVSGRCEGILNPHCKAKLALGAKCDEHSDCISGRCSWGLVCVDKQRGIDTGAPKKGNYVIFILLTAVFACACFMVYKFVKEKRAGYEEIETSIVV